MIPCKYCHKEILNINGCCEAAADVGSLQYDIWLANIRIDKLNKELMEEKNK